MRDHPPTFAESVSRCSCKATTGDPSDLAEKTSGKIGFFARRGSLETFASGMVPATSFRDFGRKSMKHSRPSSSRSFARNEPNYALCACLNRYYAPRVSRCIKAKTSARLVITLNLNVKNPLTAGKP